MQEPVTTRTIRRILESFGATKPGKRAVEMIATETYTYNKARYWELNVSTDRIKQAVEACIGLEGEASYAAFATALQIKSVEAVSKV
jgi:hypothetical protein